MRKRLAHWELVESGAGAEIGAVAGARPLDEAGGRDSESIRLREGSAACWCVRKKGDGSLIKSELESFQNGFGGTVLGRETLTRMAYHCANGWA